MAGEPEATLPSCFLYCHAYCWIPTNTYLYFFKQMILWLSAVLHTVHVMCWAGSSREPARLLPMGDIHPTQILLAEVKCLISVGLLLQSRVKDGYFQTVTFPSHLRWVFQKCQELATSDPINSAPPDCGDDFSKSSYRITMVLLVVAFFWYIYTWRDLRSGV